ncbi:MAG: hypothetical protein H7145_05855 [Akkermansiaceae bacterium]|nr:hypothetical protein [Armatimonadota bacterium]
MFDVRESGTFQEILEVGLAEGQAKGFAEGQARAERQTLRDTILRIGTRRFGTPSPETTERVVGINDIPQLNRLLDRLFETESWDEFCQK